MTRQTFKLVDIKLVYISGILYLQNQVKDNDNNHHKHVVSVDRELLVSPSKSMHVL